MLKYYNSISMKCNIRIPDFTLYEVKTLLHLKHTSINRGDGYR
jgi:hypothetical protein